MILHNQFWMHSFSRTSLSVTNDLLGCQAPVALGEHLIWQHLGRTLTFSLKYMLCLPCKTHSSVHASPPYLTAFATFLFFFSLHTKKEEWALGLQFSHMTKTFNLAPQPRCLFWSEVDRPARLLVFQCPKIIFWFSFSASAPPTFFPNFVNGKRSD